MPDNVAPTLVTSRSFGLLPDGTDTKLITLRSDAIELSVTDFGARVVSLHAPNRNGGMADISLGYNDATNYATTANAYFGATLGRVTNRIARGHFTLDGKQYSVPPNNDVNALHGGPQGYDLRTWKTRLLPDGVRFSLHSPDGDQGFPGELHITASYTLTGNRIQLDYTASASSPTLINLTNHTYFNLDGEGQPSILDHELTLYADHFTPIDPTSIPTGELASVVRTPFDFTQPHALGERIEDVNTQLTYANGYDHNYVLRGPLGKLHPCARLHSPASGRTLEVSTTEPGVQLYTGNFLDGSLIGHSGKPYLKRSGVCLETQHFPDTPNHPNFPFIRLDPGHIWTTQTVWTLST